MAVMAKWCSSAVVQMLNDTTEPKGWRRLLVVSERDVSCERLQVLVASLLRRHWEWQEHTM